MGASGSCRTGNPPHTQPENQEQPNPAHPTASNYVAPLCGNVDRLERVRDSANIVEWERPLHVDRRNVSTGQYIRAIALRNEDIIEAH